MITMDSKDDNTPLILVFYIDRGILTNKDFREAYINSVNGVIENNGANIITFFLPTDGDDRIECINPISINKVDHSEVVELVDDLKKNFGF